MKDRPLTNEEAARIILATSTDELSLRWARAVLGVEEPKESTEEPETKAVKNVS